MLEEKQKSFHKETHINEVVRTTSVHRSVLSCNSFIFLFCTFFNIPFRFWTRSNVLNHITVHLVLLQAEAVVRVEFFMGIDIMIGMQFLYWTQGGTAACSEGLPGIFLSSWYSLRVDYTTTGSLGIVYLVTLFCCHLEHRDISYTNKCLLVFSYLSDEGLLGG